MNQESRICEKELALERLHQGLKMLGLAVDALPEILSAEEEALAEHNISKAEGVLRLKKDAGQALTGCREHTEAMTENLRLAFELPPANESLNLKGLGELLRQIAGNPHLAVPEQCQKKATAAWQLCEQIRAKFAGCKMRTEKNRILITTLLKNHEASYRFWSSLIKKKNSCYNSKGTIKKPEKLSQIITEA